VAGEDVIVCGRSFRPADLEEIRAIIAARPAANRRQIATRTCETLSWRTPAGGLKEMSCRVALLRLMRQGLIELPPPRNGNGNGKAYRVDRSGFLFEGLGDSIDCGVGALERLDLRVVESREDSRRWNAAVQQYHYLGYKPLAGAQMRYLVESGKGLLGVLSFGASAWKVAPRDRWIGWTHEQRKARLHLVVNNARFLILPWVHSRNLASWILGRCARRIASDFEARYHYRPVLLETFVERERFRGTCYQAANWHYLGDTQGRGKLDRYRRRLLPVKKIYAYPLAPQFRKVLCS